MEETRSEEKRLEIVVFSPDLKEYVNEYSRKFKTEMYVEKINVNPLTCVYNQWKSTRYKMDSMPTARIFG